MGLSPLRAGRPEVYQRNSPPPTSEVETNRAFVRSQPCLCV
jgi:hypothetical protein